MATKTKQGFCENCQASRLGQKDMMSDGMGCLLTVLTGGLFLLLWLPYRWLVEAPKPYRCPQCGGPVK